VRLGTSDINVFNDIYRRHEYEWNLGSSPKVIVDAGAYTGLSTSFFATRYPDATIIAVEPDEENFELLVRNTTRYANVHTVRAALWAESGSVSIMDPGHGAWGLRLLESDDSSTVAEAIHLPGSRSVRAVTITEIIRDYNLEKIDLLKVDVEGSEKEIFANANPWIASVEAICLELHDRFKAGCSRSFFKAVDDFPIELRRGEDVLVMRDQSHLIPLLESARS
jgi:FkbM family methyltransferase